MHLETAPSSSTLPGGTVDIGSRVVAPSRDSPSVADNKQLFSGE